MKKQLGILALVTLIFNINGEGLLGRPELKDINLMVSLDFLVFWFMYGVYNGWRRQKYLVSAAIFCGIGLIVSLTNFIFKEHLFLIFYYFVAPLVGILSYPNSSPPILLFIWLLPFAVTISGYYVGKRFGAVNDI